MDESEYQKEYDKAAAELDSAATPATTEPVKEEGVTPEPEKAPEQQEPDPLAEIREKLEKTEKALKDTQAWGTRNAQALARIEREAQERKRQAERPPILDANPELEQAIRYVVPQQEAPEVNHQEQWKTIVESAHPGIFDKSIDPELENALMGRLSALGDAVSDPLVVIREITAEKIAHTERQIGKRFAAEAAKMAQRSAMSVPGAGAGGAKVSTDPDLEAKNRILNMSPAEFEKERRKVLGY